MGGLWCEILLINNSLCFYNFISVYLMYGISEAGEYDVITYKGSALLMASIEAGETITVSGNAETSGSEIYITGDCAITIS